MFARVQPTPVALQRGDKALRIYLNDIALPILGAKGKVSDLLTVEVRQLARPDPNLDAVAPVRQIRPARFKAPAAPPPPAVGARMRLAKSQDDVPRAIPARPADGAPRQAPRGTLVSRLSSCKRGFVVDGDYPGRLKNCQDSPLKDHWPQPAGPGRFQVLRDRHWQSVASSGSDFPVYIVDNFRSADCCQ